MIKYFLFLLIPVTAQAMQPQRVYSKKTIRTQRVWRLDQTIRPIPIVSTQVIPSANAIALAAMIEKYK
jgi:hypothetical protein